VVGDWHSPRLGCPAGPVTGDRRYWATKQEPASVGSGSVGMSHRGADAPGVTDRTPWHCQGSPGEVLAAGRMSLPDRELWRRSGPVSEHRWHNSCQGVDKVEIGQGRYSMYCPSCGSNVTRRGSDSAPAAPRGDAAWGPPADSPPTQFPSTGPGDPGALPALSGLTDNVAATLAYITLIPAILFLMLEPYNRRPFVRFHAWQCIFLCVASMVIHFGLGIVFRSRFTRW